MLLSVKEKNMRTQITIGGRNCGKSTHLIKRAHEEGLYILVSNKMRAAGYV